MPQLPKIQMKRIILPSTEQLPPEQQIWIEHKSMMTVSDFIEYDASLGDIVNTIRILSQVITNWNVTDDNGQMIPITTDTIGLLSATDLGVLADIVKELTPDMKGTVSEAEKKALSAS